MPRLPFLKFFPNDWLAEPSLRMLSVAARGLWIDLLSLMHLAPRRGYLLSASGTPLTHEQIARLTGCSSEEVSQLMAELKSSGCCSCTDDGTIYSRRMVKDESKREKCVAAGRHGGQISANKRATLEGPGEGGTKGQVKRNKLPIPSPPVATIATPKTPKEKVQSTSIHQQAVTYFCTRWKDKYKAKYPFNGGKDGSAMKRILIAVEQNLERLQNLVENYLNDTDQFYSADNHSLSKLAGNVTRYLPGVPASQQPKAGYKTHDERILQDMFDIMGD